MKTKLTGTHANNKTLFIENKEVGKIDLDHQEIILNETDLTGLFLTGFYNFYENINKKDFESSLIQDLTFQEFNNCDLTDIETWLSTFTIIYIKDDDEE